jgi:hypothetical protein
MLRRLLPLFGLMLLSLACHRDDTDPTGSLDKAGILKSTQWKLDRVATPDNQTIAPGRLSLETQAIFRVNIEFKDPDITRAIDQDSKQVLNGGTWKLLNNDATLDVNVTGFKGQFKLVELTRTKLVLGNAIPVDGQTRDANLEFSPAR